MGVLSDHYQFMINKQQEIISRKWMIIIWHPVRIHLHGIKLFRPTKSIYWMGTRQKKRPKLSPRSKLRPHLTRCRTWLYLMEHLLLYSLLFFVLEKKVFLPSFYFFLVYNYKLLILFFLLFLFGLPARSALYHSESFYSTDFLSP